MQMVRDMALALIVDGLMVQLPEKMKGRPYMVKIFRAMAKKNVAMSRNNSVEFNSAFRLAERTGEAVTRTGKNHSSISRAIQFIIEREPWLIKFYKLNPKHLDKMYNAFYNDDIIFRSSVFASTTVKCLDEEYTHYLYNKENP